VIVLDASVARELLLNTPVAPRIAARVLAPRESLSDYDGDNATRKRTPTSPARTVVAPQASREKRS